MKIEFEGICYALVKTNTIHPIAHQRHDLIWYPETGMPLLDQIQYRPYVKSVVTENPWIISCYDRENVRVWKNGEWVRPNEQTYGASVNHIMMSVLGIQQTIPSIPLDGGKEINQLRTKLEKSYSKSS